MKKARDFPGFFLCAESNSDLRSQFPLEHLADIVSRQGIHEPQSAQSLRGAHPLIKPVEEFRFFRRRVFALCDQVGS